MNLSCCHCGLTPILLFCRNGKELSLCSTCLPIYDSQQSCYICKEFFNLDELFVTTRDFKSVDICKPCSLKTVGSTETATITYQTPKYHGVIHKYHGVIHNATYSTYVPINYTEISQSSNKEKKSIEDTFVRVLVPRTRKFKIRDSG